MSFDLRSYLVEQTECVNQALDRLLPQPAVYPSIIHQAMRYSIDAGGKRLRPLLALAAAAAVGGQASEVLPAACALECLHTYSLIHDDLPAMDDDDLRRGLPTNHKVFGEDVAILAGDALLTLAFGLLAEELPRHSSAERVVQVISELSITAGSLGLIGGQVADVQWERGRLTGDPAETLQYIHQHKTGALISSSVRIGAILGGATPAQLLSLTGYADCLGLVFQIVDDLLDVTGDEQRLGKRVNKDAARGKLTYPGVYGVSLSQEKIQELWEMALCHLESFGEEAEPLRELASYLVNRDH